MSFQSSQVPLERPSGDPLPLNFWQSLPLLIPHPRDPQAHPDPSAPEHNICHSFFPPAVQGDPGDNTQRLSRPRGDLPCVRNRLAHSPRCPFPLFPSAAAGWGASLSLGELTRESPELPEPPALRPAPPRSSRPPGGLGGRAHRLFPPRPPGGARESPAGAPGRGIPAPPPSSSGSAVAGPVAWGSLGEAA